MGFFGWVFYCQPWLKDIIVSGLLLALLTSLFWAFNQKKRSEEHLAKMMKDMESLTKAERMLQEMQSHMQDEGEEREYHEEQVSTRIIKSLIFSINWRFLKGFLSVLWIRMFFGLPDPDSSLFCTEAKKVRTLISTILCLLFDFVRMFNEN